ncbi:hypothetical protein ACN38_g11180 [Penicillium nordicum]|uniref:Uncharacterized protein n=1 Tax=Penicillium nordicum TaxID=229535 RepID=A0A0M8NV88_9EURO|nr:hypothetical protein ACN38_g11180 [Penicillium nordicum]
MKESFEVDNNRRQFRTAKQKKKKKQSSTREKNVIFCKFHNALGNHYAKDYSLNKNNSASAILQPLQPQPPIDAPALDAPASGLPPSGLPQKGYLSNLPDPNSFDFSDDDEMGGSFRKEVEAQQDGNGPRFEVGGVQAPVGPEIVPQPSLIIGLVDIQGRIYSINQQQFPTASPIYAPAFGLTLLGLPQSGLTPLGLTPSGLSSGLPFAPAYQPNSSDLFAPAHQPNSSDLFTPANQPGSIDPYVKNGG